MGGYRLVIADVVVDFTTGTSTISISLADLTGIGKGLGSSYFGGGLNICGYSFLGPPTNRKLQSKSTA